VVLLCDGNTVVESDLCAMSITDVETCDAECYQGECVDCVPSSGVICMEGAVHQLDSCGEVGSELETCEFGCSNGRCVEEECEPRASLDCVSNLLVAVDSCGNQGNVEQLCDGECAEGACEGCNNEGNATCYDGDIYDLDSCGQIGSRDTDCDETCRTMGDGTAECVDAAECMASQSIACALGDIHTVDSCGNVLAEIVEECPNGCDSDGCRPCQPRPVGTQCLGGSIYRLVGGCDDPPAPEETPLETCEFGCAAGNCLDSECSPGAGRTCSQGNVHDVDSCDSIGAMLEACPNGCQNSACLPVPGEGGVGGDSGADGGSPQGGSDAGNATDGGTTLPVDGGALDASTP
jgi:hypothetical protein